MNEAAYLDLPWIEQESQKVPAQGFVPNFRRSDLCSKQKKSF